MKLYGIRPIDPRNRFARIARGETPNAALFSAHYGAPFDTTLNDQILAGLTAGEIREIVAIRLEGIEWGTESQIGAKQLGWEAYRAPIATHEETAVVDRAFYNAIQQQQKGSS